MTVETRNLPGHSEATTPREITVFVCVSCQPSGNGDLTPGLRLVDTLQAKLRAAGASDVTIARVECLAVCNRACTVAVSGARRWTYLIGDVDPKQNADAFVSAILAYQRTLNGILPWADRPACFRKGVIARIPPLGSVRLKK